MMIKGEKKGKKSKQFADCDGKARQLSSRCHSNTCVKDHEDSLLLSLAHKFQMRNKCHLSALVNTARREGGKERRRAERRRREGKTWRTEACSVFHWDDGTPSWVSDSRRSREAGRTGERDMADRRKCVRMAAPCSSLLCSALD